MSFVKLAAERYNTHIIIFLLMWSMLASTAAIWIGSQEQVSPVKEGQVIVELSVLDKINERMDLLEARDLARETTLANLVADNTALKDQLVAQRHAMDLQAQEVKFLREEIKSRDDLIKDLRERRGALEREVTELNRKLSYAVFGN